MRENYGLRSPGAELAVPLRPGLCRCRFALVLVPGILGFVPSALRASIHNYVCFFTTAVAINHSILLTASTQAKIAAVGRSGAVNKIESFGARHWPL